MFSESLLSKTKNVNTDTSVVVKYSLLNKSKIELALWKDFQYTVESHVHLVGVHHTTFWQQIPKYLYFNLCHIFQVGKPHLIFK